MNPLASLIGIIAIIYVIAFARRTAGETPDGSVSLNPLTGLEKLNVWLVNIVNPVLSGAILYFTWRKKLPTKAKQANTISFIVFGVEFVVAFVLVFWFGLAATNSTRSSIQTIPYHSDTYQFTVDFPAQPKIEKKSAEPDLYVTHIANRTLLNGSADYYVDVVGQATHFSSVDLESIAIETLGGFTVTSTSYVPGKVYGDYTGASYEYRAFDGGKTYILKGISFIEPRTNRVYDVGVFYDEALSSYMQSGYPAYINSFSLK